MDAEDENNKEFGLQKPAVFIKSITFNDGTTLQLERNSIVVFTGANNCGKSQALKDIEKSLEQIGNCTPIVIRSIEPDFIGDIHESLFFDGHFNVESNKQCKITGTEDRFGSKQSVITNWKNHKLENGLLAFFVKRLNTESRLNISNALSRSERNPETRPLYKLYKDSILTERISSYFHQAFNANLVIDKGDFREILLHVGKAPERDKVKMTQEIEYYNAVANLPKLQAEGDGMRGFAGILLDTFTSEQNITLIDEPEAFLHPPQARVLGEMLAKNNPNSRQLIIATHSEYFLQGLLYANTENVIVVRITREDNVNRISFLNNDKIKELWGDPLLRYSNILSGLFYEKVVVCESYYDCLFYQALIDAVFELKKDVPPSILFVHCGGKERIKDVAKALKAVNVPIVGIYDFDTFEKMSNIRGIVKTFDIEWDRIKEQVKIFCDAINKRKCKAAEIGGETKKREEWVKIKKGGKNEFDGEALVAYDEIEGVCKSAGLFVVPVGELESFYQTKDKQKKDWVYFVLENGNLATAPELEVARKFVGEIIAYKPNKGG